MVYPHIPDDVLDTVKEDSPEPLMLSGAAYTELIDLVFGARTPVHDAAERNTDEFVPVEETEREGVSVACEVEQILCELNVIAPGVAPRLIHENVAEEQFYLAESVGTELDYVHTRTSEKSIYIL